MQTRSDNYGLDLHCSMILDEYRESVEIFSRMEGIIRENLQKQIKAGGIYINALESRIKTEKSLAGKLELKGAKYGTLSDVTDIVGARVITFYTDEVDKISAIVDRIFDVDWQTSVDKRKMHDLNSFGYNSLHYICRIPKRMYYDPEMPQINELRFEIQMRTALQHVWATMYHDTGYKSGVEVPVEYLRNLNRLAGMLELADEQFSTIRTNINDYRRKVQSLVSTGKFDEVPLNGDSWSSYLKLRPFDKLNKRIAAINQAEIYESPLLPYLSFLLNFSFKTLGDVERLIHEDSEDAYQLALFQIGNTDLDIISSTVAIQNLLTVHILKSKGGEGTLTHMLDLISGSASEGNRQRARHLVEMASQLKFMQEEGKN